MASAALLLHLTVILQVTFGMGNLLMYFPATLKRGFFEKYRLMKAQFAPNSTLLDMQVSFNFSTECGYPELPSWLHLEQRRASAPAFLYGAAGVDDQSTTLEVIGWDKETYSTKRIVENINVDDDDDNSKNFPWYQAEFFIKNRTLDKFLTDDDDQLITGIVRKYWDAKDLGLTMVITAIRHGGRIPLPKSNNHEGVIVRVGSNEMWPTDNSSLSPGKEPNEDFFRDQGFEIDWSVFKWIDLRKEKRPEAERQALLPRDSIPTSVSYTPPELDDSARDFEIDFILIVIIPIIIILILVLILSLIMCFGREGRRKRDQQTPTIKLTHHHNIQRSTLRLRELSNPREEDSSPHSPSEDPSRPRHAHGDYERLADDDDDRTDGRNAPPPYRMPPGTAGKGDAQQV